MDSKEVLTLIQLALGKASVAFMSQPDGGKIVMPTEELLETANELCEAIMAMARKDYARIAELEAECARLTTERDAAQAAMVDGALREAALLARAERAERFISDEGYRRCDIPACNCPYWHGGNASNRLREISEVLGDRTQGVTILNAVRALVEACEGGESNG